VFKVCVFISPVTVCVTLGIRTLIREAVFLASDLGSCDAAGSLRCWRRRCRETVSPSRWACSVPRPAPAADALRAVGTTVTALPIRHPLDFRGMRLLRAAVREANPAVVHASVRRVRAARLVLSRRAEANTPRLWCRPRSRLVAGGRWLAARQLRRADRIIATGWAEGERYRRLGVRGTVSLVSIRQRPSRRNRPTAPRSAATCPRRPIPN